MIFVCCAGVFTTMLCLCGITTTAKTTVDIRAKIAADAERKKQNQANASESQIDVDNQYVLPDEIDIDIFGSKKRKMKVNQDDLNSEGNEKIETTKPQSADSTVSRLRKSAESTNSDSSRLSMNSGKGLIRSDESIANDDELQNSEKKLVVEPSQKDIRNLAAIK